MKFSGSTSNKTNRELHTINTSNTSIQKPIHAPQLSGPGSSNPASTLPPPGRQTKRDQRPSGAPLLANVDTTNQWPKPAELGNLFIQQSREEIQPFLFSSCIAPIYKSGWNHPTLSGCCQSVAAEWMHTAGWSLWVRLVGMKEGGWQGYTYSLAADLWLQAGKSREASARLTAECKYFPLIFKCLD